MSPTGARGGGRAHETAAFPSAPPSPPTRGRGAEAGADWPGARRPLAGRAPVRGKEVEAADWPAAAPAPPSLAGGAPMGGGRVRAAPVSRPSRRCGGCRRQRGRLRRRRHLGCRALSAPAPPFPLFPPCERVPQGRRDHLSAGLGGHTRSSVFHRQDDGFPHRPHACGGARHNARRKRPRRCFRSVDGFVQKIKRLCSAPFLKCLTAQAEVFLR